MGENVKIPLSLMNQTVDLLECIDVTDFDPVLSCYYKIVLSEFRKKQLKLDLRKTYEKYIFTEDEDERFRARIRYLQEKRDIREGR